ncbi:MAG: amino acid ABC transporter permease [Clostridia bacterium]|nr:amino acid ABC transporter permease [Clostridia bacterium]
MSMLITVTKNLLEGFSTTFEIFGLTLLMALPLGLIISFGSMSRFKVIRWPIRTIIWIIRGTPLMLQLIIFGFGPGFIGIKGVNTFVAAIVAFVINYACYFSEIFRGGIESIPKGQYEAGQVLGLTKTQTFFKVVLMQVVKRIVPPMSNEFLTLVKDTSLANTIMVYEIIWNAKRLANASGILWPLFYSGVFYLAFCGILTLIFGYVEKKLNYYRG